MPCNLALEAMGKNFSQVTFNGVAEKGAEPPPMRPPSTKKADVSSHSDNNNDCPHHRQDADQDYQPKFGSKDYFAKRARTCCSEKTVRRKLPVLNWMPKYTTADFIGDLIAGITVGFTIIPQGIAFAELAHLPVEYGLYSGFLGSFLYIFLGTVKEITIGPAAVICILLGGASADQDSQQYVVVYTVLLCMISGLFCFSMGALKLGVVVEFISAPVIAGFVSAAAIVIICSQFKSILGLHGIHGEQLLTILPGVYSKLDETNYYDMAMGLVSIAVLIGLQEIKNVRWERFVDSPMTVKTISRVVWVFSAARNVLWILICCVTAGVLNHKNSQKLFTLTQSVRVSGVPAPSLPRFTVPAENVTLHNGEVKFVPEMHFMDILIQGGTAVFIIPLICLVEQIAVCKSFAKAKPVDVNQELTSLGIAQTLSVFFQSMPVTGSICRSAVNAVSGVRTPFGGLWSGMIVLCALSFCTPYLEYIPKAALGAIVICAVIHMIEFKETAHIWHTKRRDMFPLIVTFGCCLFIGLEWGFLIGVVVNILMLLFFAATPRVPILKFKLAEDKRVVILRPDRSLHYPGVEKVRNLLSKKALMNRDAIIVVDCVNLIDIDYTGAKGLGSVAAALQARNQKIVFVNVNPGIARALKGFSHGDVETYEFAQDWIDTLTNPNTRRFLHNSWSSPERAKVRSRPRLWSIGGVLPQVATTTSLVPPDDIEGGATPTSTASSVTEGSGSATDTDGDMELEAEVEQDNGAFDNSDYIDEHGVDIRL